MSVINIKDRKKELRARCKKIRIECDSALKAELDRKLSERFLFLDEYRDHEIILAYISTEIEFDTSAIIKRAFADGKKVAVPRCRDDEIKIDFYYIKSYSQLEKRAFGLMEPNPEKCELVTDFSGALCIVPGLSFDLDGYRLGFGKGYYDRFLESYGGMTVGICYSRLVKNELPRGNYDKAVDIVLTEKYTNFIPKS